MMGGVCGRGACVVGVCMVGSGACMAGGTCVAGRGAWQILRDTVNERAVRILLGCILVTGFVLHFTDSARGTEMSMTSSLRHCINAARE